MEAIDEWTTTVRWALRHLYDPNALRSSPLIALLGLQDDRNPAKRLRELLIAAIEAMEPGQDVPEQSKAWRMYEVLLYRYVQQSGQSEVADQLGIGVRHLRREEVEAISALTYMLARHHAPALESAPPRSDRQAVAQAVASLHPSTARCIASLDETLPGVFATIGPLAELHRVHLHQPELAPLRGVCVCVEAVVLRQILINLLSVAIRQTPLGRVALDIHPGGATVRLQVGGEGRLSEVPLDANDTSNLGLTRDLAQAAQGEFMLSLPGEPFRASVMLPALEAVTVLAIDDNGDALGLLQRYASGTRYRIVPLAQPEQAVDLALSARPQIIVLDVMMPSVDGWEVMGRLRQHPDARHIPLVVCTILAHEELARSLGASAFIHKPVTRQVFLAALDQQAAKADSSSRR
jgi:CheY-like chemotaxis protein